MIDKNWYVAEARRLHPTGRVALDAPAIEVDRHAVPEISSGNLPGAWVQAWIWIPEPSLITQRRTHAKEAAELYDYGPYKFEAIQEDWRAVSAGDTWQCRVRLSDKVKPPWTEKFIVRFKPNSAEVEEAYVRAYEKGE